MNKEVILPIKIDQKELEYILEMDKYLANQIKVVQDMFFIKEKEWSCACTWKGYPANMMSNSSGNLCCPNCGGSGGLILSSEAKLLEKNYNASFT